jgi:hypothetical protein
MLDSQTSIGGGNAPEEEESKASKANSKKKKIPNTSEWEIVAETNNTLMRNQWLFNTFVN